MIAVVSAVPNFRAECIFILNRLLSRKPGVPATVAEIAADLTQRHHIPASILETLFAPFQALEKDIVGVLHASGIDPMPLFQPELGEENWLPWAFFVLEAKGCDFAAPSLADRRKLLAITLNCDISQVAFLESEASVYQFLGDFPCDGRLKWACSQLWQNPLPFYRCYTQLLALICPVLEHHWPVMQPLVEATRSFLIQALEDDEAGLLSRFCISNIGAANRVLLTPTIGGYNGTGVYWDHTEASQTILLIYGLCHNQLQALIGQYSSNSKTMANRLKILADPNRLEILMELLTGPLYSQELQRHLELSPGTITHHMALLCGEGFVKMEKDGVRVKYSLCQQELSTFLYGLQGALLKKAEGD